jgi:hypothetical protein
VYDFGYDLSVQLDDRLYTQSIHQYYGTGCDPIYSEMSIGKERLTLN